MGQGLDTSGTSSYMDTPDMAGRGDSENCHSHDGMVTPPAAMQQKGITSLGPKIPRGQREER